jgi:hypothetical protein
VEGRAVIAALAPAASAEARAQQYLDRGAYVELGPDGWRTLTLRTHVLHVSAEVWARVEGRGA